MYYDLLNKGDLLPAVDCADDDEDIVSGGVYCGSSRENGKIETGWIIIIINFPPIRVYCGLNFESPSRWWCLACLMLMRLCVND